MCDYVVKEILPNLYAFYYSSLVFNDSTRSVHYQYILSLSWRKTIITTPAPNEHMYQHVVVHTLALQENKISRPQLKRPTRITGPER